MSVAGLESIDGIPLDGLEYCARAYSIFDSIRNASGGVSELRLRTSKRAKRMMEEVLPIASYVQAKHGPALRLTVTWCGGNQPYDANIQCSGLKVDRNEVPQSYFLEVTTSEHDNNYLVRENLDATGGSFAPRNTERDHKTRQIISAPSVYSGDEREEEVVEHVLRVAERKQKKTYQDPTVLLIQCSIFCLISDEEWSVIVAKLRNGRAYGPFKEVYVLEPNGSRLERIG